MSSYNRNDKHYRNQQRPLVPSYDPYSMDTYVQPCVIPYEHTYHYFPTSTSKSLSSSPPTPTTIYSPTSFNSPSHNRPTTTPNSTSALAPAACSANYSSHPPASNVAMSTTTNSISYVNNNHPSSSTSSSRYHSARTQIFKSSTMYNNDQQQSNSNNQYYQAQNSSKLIWLMFMHRHGDRSPINMAPRDPYNNISYWPEGFGNLNNAGRMRMYKLGQFIRNRYKDFLTDNMREVYSRSSDVDRCIESAQALLAGLYPPNEINEWHPKLIWTPAPVHTVPSGSDYLLNEAGKKYLDDYVKEIHLIQQSEAVRQLYADSVKERELLERELGYEFDLFTKFKCTYSSLDIEEREGLEMPAWYTPELKQKLYRFSGLAFKLAGSGTETLKKIRSGHLLQDLIERMEMASIEGPMVEEHDRYQCTPTITPNNSPKDKKVVHYSTHDSIVTILLEALAINEPTPIPPGFGATIFMELHVDLNENGMPNGEKYIKFFYMDDTGSEKPVEKKLPVSCKLNEKGQVTLNNFREYVGHLLPRGKCGGLSRLYSN